MTRNRNAAGPNCAAADLIADKRDEILSEWHDIVCDQIEGAGELGKPSLLDDVPEILLLIERALRQGQTHADQDFHPVRAHGEQRAQLTDADIEWMRREMALLRTVVLEHLETDLGRLPRPHLLLVHEVFEKIMSVSVDAYLAEQVKRAEQARKAAEHHTEELRELTALLQREREQRDLFVSAIVHDLRTPLATVQMASDILARFPENPEMCEAALDKLQRNVDRIDALAQRLLDINRITAGRRLPLDIAELNLSQAVRQFVQDAQVTHGADKIQADISEREDAGGQDIIGWWNKEAIYRSLSNLVENALKYGSAPVTVRLKATDERVTLEVHDEGDPIPPSEQERIFERFVRLKTGREKDEGGWGLGLTLVRGLAHALGGELEIDSRPGLGTTFSIYLPWDARGVQEG